MTLTLRKQIDTLTEENNALRSVLCNFAELIDKSFDDLRTVGVIVNAADLDDDAPKDNGVFSDAALYAGGRLNQRRARKRYERGDVAKNWRGR